METIPEKEKLETKEDEVGKEVTVEEQLAQRLNGVTTSTESIGHRNVRHRRVQSTSLLFSILDNTPSQTQQHRVRSMSLAEYPSLDKYYPGSHLLVGGGGGGGLEDSSCLYLSLWLLPPLPLRQQLAKEIAKMAMRYSHHGSSAPFMPHITIIGSIRCETHREATQLGKQLQKGLKGSGVVPCRFQQSPCVAMYTTENKIVWSQSCIAIVERSEEYMNLLALSRQIFQLPLGEWMFPGPACEPHYSTFYGTQSIPTNIPPPPNFVAEEAALVMTTPGTLEGVAKWREVARIHLR